MSASQSRCFKRSELISINELLKLFCCIHYVEVIYVHSRFRCAFCSVEVLLESNSVCYIL